MRVTSPRFRIVSVAVLVLAAGSTVVAWKPKSHVHLAEVAVPRALFAAILARIGRLRAAPSTG